MSRPKRHHPASAATSPPPAVSVSELSADGDRFGDTDDQLEGMSQFLDASLEQIAATTMKTIGDMHKGLAASFATERRAYFCRADTDESRRRRGWDANSPRRRVAAGTRIVRGDESRLGRE